MKSTIKNVIIKWFVFCDLLHIKMEGLKGQAIFSRVKNKGINCKFEGAGYLYEEDKISIGNHCFIGRDFFIRAGGKVKIGNYTHISRNVVIHTVNHNINGELLPYDKTNIVKDVEIGDYVWIGMNVNILPGVKIGDGAVIGMGVTISKSINAGDIVVGSSFRVVGKRNSNETKHKVLENKFLRMDK